MAFSVADIINRIASRRKRAIDGGLSLYQVLIADCVSAGESTGKKGIQTASGNGASATFFESDSRKDSVNGELSLELKRRYAAAVSSLSVSESDFDSSLVSAIAQEMDLGCVSIRSFRPDFSALGVNQ